MTPGAEKLPWLWLPALWLLAFDWYVGPFSFTPVFLLVPLAALLGARYGRRALGLVALGGLPLLPPVAVSLGFVSLGSAPDVYAVALAVCALVASERPVVEQAAERVPRFGGWAFAAALVVLPMTLSLWGTELGALRISVMFGLTGLFWLLLFLLGWSGFPARWAVAGLALAAASGMWLHAAVTPADGRMFFSGPQAELPLFGLTRMEHLWWDYRFDSPAAFLAGVGYFAAGGLWAEMLRTRVAPLAARDAWSLVLVVATLALGFIVNRSALMAIGFEPHALPRYGFLLGAPLALPLTGLLAALLLGRRGLAVAVLAVPAFWVLDAFAMSGFRLPLYEFRAPLHQPLCVLGFGLLGLAMRGRALGIAAAPSLRVVKAPPPPVWAPLPGPAAGASAGRYAALVLAALPVLGAGALALTYEERIVAAAKALLQERRTPPAVVQRRGAGHGILPKKSGSEP
ncbi:MAG TPA: hypothetical protein VH600_04190 [Burkholderiales bacterium]|jgi:hypothetical protein